MKNIKSLVNNRNIYILLIILAILIGSSGTQHTSSTQMIAPGCFSKEDCKVDVAEGFCDVSYDCYAGKCWQLDVPCTEICYGGIDDDSDGYTDCTDADCYTSKMCPCEQADFNACKIHKCYCPEGKTSAWFNFDGLMQCACK